MLLRRISNSVNLLCTSVSTQVCVNMYVCECLSTVTVFADESVSKPEVDIASIFFLVFEMQ